MIKKIQILFTAIFIPVLIVLMFGFSKAKLRDFRHVSSGISLPDGFSATVVADNLGRARHIAVNGNDVYVKLERLVNGKGILRLRDLNNDAVADEITGFGNYPGTGIALQGDYLYASSNDDVFRYRMNNGEVDTMSKERIVTGLLNKRQHASKSIALDFSGNIYVNIGAPSNNCQEKDRVVGSPGMDPCPILDSAAAVWQFKTDKADQSYSQGIRYVTGIRNIVGLDWNKQVNELYAVQHGRDDFNRLYPDLYSVDESVNLPGEELLLMKKGSDFGWPYCYYDHFQKKKLLSPEYGGDKKTVGRCSDKDLPIYSFPAHWGPNALLFYTGNQFPEKYRNGAFIAWHGSWNRAPREQEGYFVTFLPFKDGKPSGEFEIFADGFAGENKTPGGAMYRPCGLAQGPDGALYVSDDQKGRIWKITFKGNSF